ncbi:ProQ/FINO family protein [Providencia rettgeri]|uniref:ProQ/FINO family protein n=1 Tax=Providencia rettgeri TaxID=587 RepID=UPI00223C502B
MERKKLTLKRATTENVAESTEPVIQRRRKQVVVNTPRKPHKPAKTAPTQPTKKVTPPPAKKQKAVVIPLEKKVIPPTPPKKHLPLEEAITNISEYWPQLFPNEQLRPMAVGTREALLADKKVRELPISTKKLKRSLAAISHSVKYRTTIMPGAVRYDKDGQPNGTVTESDVADTLKRIQKLVKQQSRPA